MDRMAEEGHKVILATPSGAKPAWMSRRYPEIRRVTREGLREPHAGRHNHCWSSPVYREKVSALNGRLAERYARHPALGMWHISNEFNGECFCERCLGAFHRWLAEKYGTLDRLNRAWWTAFWSHTFTAWEEIDPRDDSVDGMRLDWRRFASWQIGDFYRHEIAPLKAANPSVPCTTNFMGLHPHIAYAELAGLVDVVADDQYPRYSAKQDDLARAAAAVAFKDDLYRNLKPGRPWFLMESAPDSPQWQARMALKDPGLHAAEMIQALGHGAEGTCYFQWRKGRGAHEKFHAAVVDHVGHEHTRVFRAVAEHGALLEKLAPILGSAVEAKVGVVFDWDSWWGFEASSGPANQGCANYREVALDHYQALWERGVPVDVVGPDADFGQFALLVLPQLWMLKPGVAARLRAFVEGGGVLVATHHTGICDETNLCFTGGWPGDGLMDVFGIWNEETDYLPPSRTVRLRPAESGPDFALPDDFRAAEVCAQIHLRGAGSVALYDGEFYAGNPAITRHQFGRGEAWYVGARLQRPGLGHLYPPLLRRAGIGGILPEPPPPGVSVQRRSKPGAEFLFVENFTPELQGVMLPEGEYRRLDTGETVAGMLPLEGYGGVVLGRGETVFPV